ncbi:shufflon system plasmid conjugative transfer pilus tip adhesin PilV [Candidatus Williamhamiltonella defendens]|uniref:shufflon system plasmid conjugative transfer pilus tip adhesin PilV n=1 Tax=Candidatus Williamhamiltonella defendens TaxID=138072 RepID=UPI001F35AEDA|nr:shufflon system plasmid conjugative transfer pilus tip adhesin PilV [Candidatus Hamiltonella defensa]
MRGGTVQLDQISISGHRCTPDGLLSRDASGALLSCQSGVWKGAGGGHLSRAGVNALSVESTGDFHFVLVSISSIFFAVDGSHTAMANFTLSLNGRVREQITNGLNVRKTGGGGHYWGYETVGVVQKQYRLTIAQGDHLRVALSSAHYHLSSDIRIDLSN